jgi:putative ATP-dependent endonuclease of OLD family
MHVRRLTIERFRGIELLELHPTTRTVLVGPNNAGKSTILEALDMLLHSGLGRPRGAPTEIDYFDRDPSTGFRIEAVLGDLTTAFLADVHEALEGWSTDGRFVVPQPDGEGIETVVRVQVRGTPEFELLHELAKPELNGARFSPRLRTQVGWVFDGRAREPARQLAFYQGGLLEQLFHDVQLGSAVDQLRTALAVGAEAVNADELVADVLTGLETDLRALGLLETGRPGFEIGAVSPRELLQTLRLALPGTGTQPIPLVRQGRGAQRLVVLAVLLRLAQSRRGPVVIGGFEEPEEALEPLRQSQAARMLAALAEAGGQIFLATHSPEIVRAFELDDVVLLDAGPRPVVRPLATTLTSPARHGYERRRDGPVVRALFLRIPVLVEGPSDRAVFEVFWRALAEANRVPNADQVGLEPVNCEGNPHLPMMTRLLTEAGKRVAVWVERDDARAAGAVIDQDLAACLLLYEDHEERNNLERALGTGVSFEGLAAAMSAVAEDRGDGWELQVADLQTRSGVVSDPTLRGQIGAAASLSDVLAMLPPAEARALVVECLRAKSAPAPFEIKGSRAARIFAESVVRTEGVPSNFADAFVTLGEWASRDTGDRATIEMRTT